MNAKVLFSIGFLSLSAFRLAAAEPSVEAISSINWITRDFTTEFSMDTKKAGLEMPSGKKSASQQIKSKMPPLIQGPLLSLFEDSEKNLSDMVVDNRITLDQVYHFIMGGYKTPDVFSQDLKFLKTKNTVNTINLTKELVRHNYSYNPEKPIEIVASRPYSGIIIDAREALPVHGEYVKSETYPCFFPKIWDEGMKEVYEKNLVDPEIIREKDMVAYHYSDDTTLYEDRVGGDPLYIKATQVFGRNRTDPIIKHKDALKIFTVPENVELLKEGKVVILLNEKNLIYKISIPEKQPSYYVQYNSIKQYFYENKVPDVTVTDSIDGIKFFVDLKFYPDSPELLPSEKTRIEAIAENLKTLLVNDGYTILIEGHTADVGKPVGQLNLSIERTRTVMQALINEGIDEGLFSYKGFGGTMPLADNETEEGRAQNRRVEITARPRQTYIQRDWN
ncbi:MAG: OmpA family protein [Treponema sp.]|nr:OmpA family protein [Treponema sp.]